jgi:hypothetical protein
MFDLDQDLVVIERGDGYVLDGCGAFLARSTRSFLASDSRTHGFTSSQGLHERWDLSRRWHSDGVIRSDCFSQKRVDYLTMSYECGVSYTMVWSLDSDDS